jgi:hypothetical protein
MHSLYSILLHALTLFYTATCPQALDNASNDWIELDHPDGTCFDTLKFHDALYFILVTASTIGYGDISPKTSLGRVVVMMMGVSIILILPGQVAEVQEVIATRRKQQHKYETYDQLRNKAASRSLKTVSSQTGHVIVAGHISENGLTRFLMEFLHPCRGHVDMNVGRLD